MKRLNCISVLMLLFIVVFFGACHDSEPNNDRHNDDPPEALSYTVTYDGNGHTAGSVPIDSTGYEQGQTVTVLGNTGSLEKEGFFFNGWNTRAEGSGTTYTQGQAFTMGTSDITLYAAWGSDYLYVSTSGDDANPGTLSEPKLTIQSAIDAATEPTEVRVAEGTYEITDQITMKDGVSLLGGYSEDFSKRDAAAHETIITDTREPTIYGVFSTIYCSEISGTVRIDGFTINGCNAVDLARSVCIYNTDSSPTISNNTITDGGTGTNTRGIENQSSSPIISNNTINVGDTEATARFTGIYNQSSSPIISNNTMSGGDTGSIERFTGINNQSSSPTILNNTINGGPN
ncbi:MAG: InlB B-repeat-containing protein, partial [Desulfobacteraceae bacterium]